MHFRLIFPIFFCFLFCLLFITGCANPDLNTFNQSYYSGDAKKAYKIATSHLKNDKNKDDLLWEVQAGITGFYLGEKNTSKLLEQADTLMQENIQNFAKSLFGNIGAILSSDLSLPYPIYLYEASMVNYYLALDSMSRHDFANARVYLNQALERQNDAKSYYAKELANTQKYLDDVKKANENSSQEQQYLAIGMGFANQESNKNISFNEHYINPMIIYMKVLFELTQNNFSAISALGKDLNYILQEDRDIIKLRQNGDHKHYIWFIIEDGKITSKDTFKISIPLPIDPNVFLNPAAMAIALDSPHGAMIITTLSGGIMLNYAEPKLVDKEIFAKRYSIDNQPATHVFELSNLMETEFYKRLPAIRTRAILRSIPPAIIAYIAEKAGEKSFGFRGFGILTSLIHRAVLSADTRMITALPNSFYLLRVENDGKMKELKIDETQSLIFKAIDSSKDDIIYIRNTSKNVYFKRLLTSQGEQNVQK